MEALGWVVDGVCNGGDGKRPKRSSVLEMSKLKSDAQDRDLKCKRAPNGAYETTRGEEWANMATHGVGLIAAMVVTVLMVGTAWREGGLRQVMTLGVFGLALIAVYGISTLYHAAKRPAWKRRLRKWDHAAIFILIAGTYTPVVLVALGGVWGWVLLGVVWGLAAVGLTLKLVCFDRFGWTQLALTLGMGWLVVLAAPVMVPALSTEGLLWLAAGGVAYTGGVGFFLWTRLPFNHAVWHVFVMAGSACHVVTMWCDVLGVVGS